jgi:hypothetical protein
MVLGRQLLGVNSRFEGRGRGSWAGPLPHKMGIDTTRT